MVSICIQMVGLSSIQMALENQINCHPTYFDHSNTKLVWYSDPHWTELVNLILYLDSFLNCGIDFSSQQTVVGVHVIS